MGRNGTNKKANKLENCTLKLLTDFVKIYDGCLAPSLCDKIINAFEADDEHHIESKIGALNEPIFRETDGKVNVYRHAIEMNCTKRATESPKWDGIMRLLNHHASSYFQKYCSELKDDGFPFNVYEETRLEQWRMHRYNPNKHYYKEHIDSIEYHSAQRMLVMLYYLNTVEEGGETKFATIDTAVKPVKGRLAIAPTWFGYPHSAEIPITESKYMIKTFVHYPRI